MDGQRLGATFRALRHRLGWRQADLARRARTSQSFVSRAERGRVDGLSVGALDRLARAMDARLDVRLLWGGERLDRLLDAAHAAAVERVVRLLASTGWVAVAEVSFAVYGERGSIDVFARHPLTGQLLVIEVKTVIGDMQGMLATLDRKIRLALRIATDRGWRTGPVSALLIMVDGTTARRRVREHDSTLRSVFPLRGRAVTRWLSAPGTEPVRGLLFLPAMRQATVRKRIRVRQPPGGTSGGVSSRQMTT